MPTATVLLGIAVTIKVHHNTQGDDEGKQQRNGTGKKENKLFNVSDKLQGLEVVNSLLARWNHEQEKKKDQSREGRGQSEKKRSHRPRPTSLRCWSVAAGYMVECLSNNPSNVQHGWHGWPAMTRSGYRRIYASVRPDCPRRLLRCLELTVLQPSSSAASVDSAGPFLQFPFALFATAFDAPSATPVSSV